MALERSTIDFMRTLDADYRRSAGLSERRYYSIFYSKVEPNPVMAIGYNPGGDPENWDESRLASRSFYENNEHEYVDCHYPLASAMRQFLAAALDIGSVDDIRSIPKTNLIFRRSSGQNTLAIRPSDALREALPYVERIVSRVQPQAIIFEGVTTLERFEALYCSGVSKGLDGPPITSPNGRNPAAIYRLDRGRVGCLGREVTFVGIGHPSKYSGRKEWSEVMTRANIALSAI